MAVGVVGIGTRPIVLLVVVLGQRPIEHRVSLARPLLGLVVVDCVLYLFRSAAFLEFARPARRPIADWY